MSSRSTIFSFAIVLATFAVAPLPAQGLTLEIVLSHAASYVERFHKQ